VLALPHYKNGMGKRLFVFDLDFTLWDAGGTWCDCVIPPFKAVNGKIYDNENALIHLYPDVTTIMQRLKSHNKLIAIASRSSSPKIANELMAIFDIKKYVDFTIIKTSSKTEHFIKLSLNSKLDFSDMVFFDDEYRNILDVKLLGVECIHITQGIKGHLVDQFI
jgi:magnesium-dependent phosphatase 1